MPDNESVIQLSERELQVLEKIATGASNKQIADDLIISIHTVKVHVRNIYGKLGVQSRTEATVRAVQEGWIVIPETNGGTKEAEIEIVATPEPQLPEKEIEHESVATAELSPVESDKKESEPEPQFFEQVVFSPNSPSTTLSRWQQIYLAVVTFLALVVAIAPVLPPQNMAKPNLSVPIIPKTLPTPPPPAPRNWSFKAPLRSARASLGLVAVAEKIFAIGGVGIDNQVTRLVEIYDSSSNSWTVGGSKPTAVANVQAVVLADQIYVPGGCDGRGQANDGLEIYDPRHDSWKVGQSLPQPRCGYGLVAFKEKLYLFGGWDGQAFVDTVLVFSIKKDKWTVLNRPMPQAKGYLGTVVLSDTIYIVGGYDGKQELAQTYIFDPKTENWLEKSPMKHGRSGLGLVSGANHLYAIGGGRTESLTISEEYDPKTNTWTDFTTPFATPWRDMGLAVVDTTLYAVGGWNDGEQKHMEAVVSYQFVYRLFLPVSTFQK